MVYSLYYVKYSYQFIQGLSQQTTLHFVGIRLSSLLQQFSTAAERVVRRKYDLRTKDSLRFEEFTLLGKSILHGSATIPVPFIIFKIMDYNILAESHMNTHIRMYKKSPQDCLNWDNRKALLTKEFDAAQPDILCLQEVEGTHRTKLFEPLKEKGYDALYVARGKDRPDGCAILYNTSRFQISDFCPVYFKRPEVPALDRPNVGMVVRLELKNNPGNYIVVANTHLLYNQRRVDIKMSQLQILLAETERIAYNYGVGLNRYHPIVLTGDLNVNAKSCLISLLTNKYVNCHEICTKLWYLVTRQKGDKPSKPIEMLRERLNISENCQYIDVVKARIKGLQDPRISKDLDSILQQHRVYTDKNLEFKCRQPSESQPATDVPNKESHSDQVVHGISNNRLSSNSLSHNFPLVNVYNHPELDGKHESSLHRTDKKLNIYDYMFYSCDARHLNQPALHQLLPGQLQLLSRLRLPSEIEFYSRIKYIPNYACGSDHLPLLASFLLPLK